MLTPFTFTTEDSPHHARHRQLRQRHPRTRALYGREPRTAAIAVGLVGLQLGVAVALGLTSAPWWLAVILAWGLGAFATHALFAVMHEATHALVFGRRGLDRAVMLFANLPALAPFAIPFRHYHLLHHRTQGQLGRDPDLPSVGEVAWFGGSRLRRLIWQLGFPFISALRAGEPGDRLRPDRWLVANVVVQVAAVVAIYASLGGTALLYLGASTYFVFALHPLFGRFIQEHFVDPRVSGRETASYYGPLNAVALNFGYHVEHHDFPAVAWSRLPGLRALAPEAYPADRAHHSWAWLWLRFTFGSELGLDKRVARPNRLGAG